MALRHNYKYEIQPVKKDFKQLQIHIFEEHKEL